MKKSELYARYDNFRDELKEIPREEFYNQLTIASIDDVRHWESGSTSCVEIRTDGATYKQYSSSWNVGWQGDIDADEFFCVIPCLTKAEIEQIASIFA